MNQIDEWRALPTPFRWEVHFDEIPVRKLPSFPDPGGRLPFRSDSESSGSCRRAMHDRQHLLRPARAHEVGVLVVDLADLLKGLGTDHDHGEGVETFGAVDGKVADRFLTVCRRGAVFDERESGDGLAGSQDAALEFGPGVQDQVP